MSLPKINHPTFEVIVPSTKKKILMRPMLVKEEKILLMAKASDNDMDILSAVKQVVNNCFITDLDIDSVSIFDIEYLFLKLRGVSVSNISNIVIIDNDDKKSYNFEIDLNKIEIKYPEQDLSKIQITDDIAIQLKYPSASVYDDNTFITSEAADSFDKLISKCIEKVFTKDEIYFIKDFSEKEVIEFIDSFPPFVYEKIRDFIVTAPRLYYKIEYSNANGDNKVIELNSLTDFFTLR